MTRRRSNSQLRLSPGIIAIGAVLFAVVYSVVVPRQEEPRRQSITGTIEDQYVASWCNNCQINLELQTQELNGRHRRRYRVDPRSEFLIPKEVEITIIEAPAIKLQAEQDGRYRLSGVSIVEFMFSYPPPER